MLTQKMFRLHRVVLDIVYMRRLSHDKFGHMTRDSGDQVVVGSHNLGHGLATEVGSGICTAVSCCMTNLSLRDSLDMYTVT